MIGFREVNFGEIEDYSSWKNAEKFTSAGRVVSGTNGQNHFCIIGKKQRELSSVEWVKSVFWRMIETRSALQTTETKSIETIRLRICIDPYIDSRMRHIYTPIDKNISIENQELNQFYATHNITLGDELISYNDQEICFENESVDNKYILKALSLYILNEINKQISERDSTYCRSKKREILIKDNMNKSPFFGVSRTLLDPSKNPNTSFSSDQAYREATFLGCAVNKLKEMGYIFSVLNVDGNGWLLQA